MADSSLWNPPANALPIWNGTPPGYRPDFNQPVPTLTPYLVSAEQPTSAVVVLPGGGYARKAPHEAEPVALWLNTLGISAFVLDYRVAPYQHPIPMLDARRAIQVVRSQSEQWNVDPNRVGILGFSAGGHLASTAGTHFEILPASAAINMVKDVVGQYSFRPDALILCYPVISFGEFAHVGSMENLLGPDPEKTQRDFLSNETQVSAHTPPTFLWHTADDPSVPVENSLLFASSLSKNQIPFDLHVFAHGAHGVGLAEDHPYASPWTGLCASWLKNIDF